MADKEIVDEGREKFSSRLGFILISAGCAIGLGNIWRFPYITGEYGGAAFVLLILFFLVVLGVPVLALAVLVAVVGAPATAAAHRGSRRVARRTRNWKQW